MNTNPNEVVDGRRRRRTHSAEFKAHLIASCAQAGVSMAAVAMANGVNANLLRRWVHEAELQGGGALTTPAPCSVTLPRARPSPSTFVPLQIPAAPAAAADIRIELRRGPTAVCVIWPASAAAECATWMRELLR